jgi:Ca2+-binding EF-hand superfamily protein
MKTLIAIAGGLILSAGAAFAGDQASDTSFEQLDKDKNGALTQSEAAADSELASVFAQADTNQDGYLTMSEFDQINSDTEEAE